MKLTKLCNKSPLAVKPIKPGEPIPVVCHEKGCPHIKHHAKLIECDPKARLEAGYPEKGCGYARDSECILVIEA